MYLKEYIQNLIKNGPIVSEKNNKFKYSYRNDLDLEYSRHILDLPYFRSQAAMVSDESTVFFSYRKTYVIKFDLVVK